MSSKSDEVARASIGVPGISVQVPIRRGWIDKLRFRWTTPLEGSIQVAAATMEVSVYERDEARITIYLHVVSFFRRDVSLRAVEVHSLLFNHVGLSSVAPNPATGQAVLAPCSVSRPFVHIALQASDVRKLMQAIRPPANPLSTPDVSASLAGALVCEARRQRATILFEVEPVPSRVSFAKDFQGKSDN